MIPSFCTRVLLSFCLLFVIQFGVAQSIFLPDTLFELSYEGSPGKGDRGYYFLAPYQVFPELNKCGAIVILDSSLHLVYYKSFPYPKATRGAKGAIVDFKIHPNGKMSYYYIDSDNSGWVILDSTFTAIDTLKCIGKQTDPHDLIMNDDGSFYIMCNDEYVADCSMLTDTAGRTFSKQTRMNLAGGVIQKINFRKELEWEWNAINHILPSDVLPYYLKDTSEIPWTHGNSIAIDPDHNLVVSLRNTGQVLNINTSNKQIRWIAGGKRSDFVIPDSIAFSHQHHVTMKRDTLIMYNNALFLNNRKPKAVAYLIDSKEKKLTRIYKAVYPTATKSTARGSHQWLPSGHHLISWGDNVQSPKISVNDSSGNELMAMDISGNFQTHRAYLLPVPWKVFRPEVKVVSQNQTTYLLTAPPGYEEYRWSNGETSPSIVGLRGANYQVTVKKNDAWYGSSMVKLPR